MKNLKKFILSLSFLLNVGNFLMGSKAPELPIIKNASYFINKNSGIFFDVPVKSIIFYTFDGNEICQFYEGQSFYESYYSQPIDYLDPEAPKPQPTEFCLRTIPTSECIVCQTDDDIGSTNFRSGRSSCKDIFCGADMKFVGITAEINFYDKNGNIIKRICYADEVKKMYKMNSLQQLKILENIDLSMAKEEFFSRYFKRYEKEISLGLVGSLGALVAGNFAIQKLSKVINL